MKKIILSAIVLTGIGAVSANAGEWNRARPEWRPGHQAIRFAEARHLQAVHVAEVRRDYAVAQAQQAEVCAQQAAIANATAIQLAAGAAPQDVIAQNIVVNQQLAAYNAA